MSVPRMFNTFYFNSIKALKNNIINILDQKLQYNILKITRNFVVLGIETSCDDTGCGIVNSEGNILANVIASQHSLHMRYGGIIPTVAEQMHARNITNLCESALKLAKLKLHNVDAIATTVKPGLPLSLNVGKIFGVRLSIIGKKAFIPIHHMEAHALVIRMIQKVKFPYLVLLISGGHCLLALVEDAVTFYLLGKSIDNAPGEALDKIARRLKLKNIPEFVKLSGGQAIEVAASQANNPMQFNFPAILTRNANCDFSFSGLKTAALLHILKCERKFNIIADKVIPDVNNFCAGFQLAITNHLCQRTQRAMEFIERHDLISREERTLVVSGGVACNNFIFESLKSMASEMGYSCLRPPMNLCTDNGLMIAWNGIERMLANQGILRDENEIRNVRVEGRSALGQDWTFKVKESSIRCKWIKINTSFSQS